MAQNRVNDTNYYQISGWMINKLNLKGIQLSVYAIIYGFSQDGESEFTGSLQYLCDFTGGTSKPTVAKALKELVEKQLIIRREEIINNVQFNRYKINLPLLKNFYGGGKEILGGGSKEILPNNNILDNNNYNNIQEKEKKYKKEKEIETEFESLWKHYPNKKGKESAYKAYCKARNNGTTYDEVIFGLENYLKEIELKKTERQYIKNGSTWFAQSCWKDDYILVTSPKNSTDEFFKELNQIYNQE